MLVFLQNFSTKPCSWRDDKNWFSPFYDNHSYYNDNYHKTYLTTFALFV